MKKIIITICFILSTNQLLLSQNRVQKLDGPRFGITYLDPGLLADIINDDRDLNDDNPVDYKQEPSLMTQIGWQWETRFTDSDEKFIGIVEWVALIAGLEKGMFLPSASSLVGIRTNKGFECALGPNFSLSGVGLAFAIGYNFKSGNLNIPVNLAFVPGINKSGKYRDINYNPIEYSYSTGNRISLLVGFNLSKN